MVRGCGNKCMKLCLFIFNLFFVGVGLALLGCGIFLLIKSQDFKAVFNTPDALAVLIIIIGASISIFAFLGCCGSIQENHCMLYVYAIVVGFVFIAEVAVVVLIIIFSSKVKETAETGMDAAVRKYQQDDPNNLVTQLVDNLQWTLKCCGSKTKADWQNFHSGLFGGGRYPKSCCFDPMESFDSGNRPCMQNQAFDTSCGESLRIFLETFLWVIAGLVLILAICQLVAACFACNIAKASE